MTIRRKPELKRIWRSGLADYITAIDWSPTGDLLAACSASGEVSAWMFPNRASLFHYRDPQSISCLQISPEGNQLAVAGQRGQVLLWDLTASQVSSPMSFDPVEAWIDRLVWQPRTQNFAFNANRQVHIAESRSCTVTQTLDFVDSSVLDLDWHPQGSYLAVCGHTGTKVWHSLNWDKEPYLLRVPGASLDAAWSGDGTYLATGNYDRTLSVLRWGNPPPWLMQGFPGKVRQLRWSDLASGDHSEVPLLAAVCVEGVTIWSREEQESDQWNSRVLQFHEGFVQSIAFRPGQRLLASADDQGKIALWLDAKKQIQVLTGSPQGFSVLAWHPQGSYLAAGGQDGTLTVWAVTQSPQKRGFG